MVVAITTSCSNNNSPVKIVDIRVNHHRNTGVAEGLFLTLLTQQGNDIGTDEWGRFYGGIEGFDYVPGYIYNLSAYVVEVENPPADGSSQRYILKEIKSTEKVDANILFDIDLKMNGQSFITTDSGYEILRQLKVDCSSLCNELDEKLQNQDFVVGTFKRLRENSIELVGIK